LESFGDAAEEGVGVEDEEGAEAKEEDGEGEEVGKALLVAVCRYCRRAASVSLLMVFGGIAATVGVAVVLVAFGGS
jgi:hypothetical protein